nr:MAG TPA: hypothetical protein [Caudoviricetes sp.]
MLWLQQSPRNKPPVRLRHVCSCILGTNILSMRFFCAPCAAMRVVVCLSHTHAKRSSGMAYSLIMTGRGHCSAHE